MTPVPSARKRTPQNSGSPKSGEPAYLIIGKLRRTHGVNGDLLMDVLTDEPEVIKAGLTVFVGPHHRLMKISGCRTAGESLLVRFEGFTDCDQAAIFRNQSVAIKTNEAQPLKAGRFYQYEIIGLNVIDENGKSIGKVTEILVTGANDVYVVQNEAGDEVLIPAVKEFVKKIDLDNGELTVLLPQWE